MINFTYFIKLLKLFKKHSTSFKDVHVSFFNVLKLNFFFAGKFFFLGGLQGGGECLGIQGGGAGGIGCGGTGGGWTGGGFLLSARVELDW